jgi:hypothetical protein
MEHVSQGADVMSKNTRVSGVEGSATSSAESLEPEKLAKAFGMEVKQFRTSLTRYLHRERQAKRIRGFHDALARKTTRPNAENCLIWVKFCTRLLERRADQVIDRDYIQQQLGYLRKRQQQLEGKYSNAELPSLFKGFSFLSEEVSRDLARSTITIRRAEETYSGCYILVRKARYKTMFYEELLWIRDRHEATENLIFDRTREGVVFSGITIFSANNLATVFLYAPNGAQSLTFRILEIQFPADGSRHSIYSGIALGVKDSVEVPVAIPVALIPASPETTALLEREGIKSRQVRGVCLQEIRGDHPKYEQYKKLPLAHAIEADHEKVVKEWDDSLSSSIAQSQMNAHQSLDAEA